MKQTIEKYGEFQRWRSWPDNSVTTRRFYTEGNLNMDGQGFKIIIGAKLFRRKDFILMKQMIMSTLK